MYKIRLKAIRDNDYDSLLNDVSLFCVHNDIDIPDMDDTFSTDTKKVKEKNGESS